MAQDESIELEGGDAPDRKILEKYIQHLEQQISPASSNTGINFSEVPTESNQIISQDYEYPIGFERKRPRASTNDSLRAQQGSPLLAAVANDLPNIQDISLTDNHNKSKNGDINVNRPQIQGIPEECEDVSMEDA